MNSLHPALADWCIQFVYGRIKGRSELDLKRRQLCALSSMAGNIVFPQFRSTSLIFIVYLETDSISVYAALNAGATLEEIEIIREQTHLMWSETSQIMIDALWRDLNKRKFVQ